MRSLNPNHKCVTHASSIGSMAYESSKEVQHGTVFGRTSRGIFIKTESKWLNFLSFERFRGPLTINLSPDHGPIPDVKESMELEISPQEIFFPEAGWRVLLEESEIWRPRKASGPSLTRDERQTRLFNLADRIMETNMQSGLASLLPRLLNTDNWCGEADKNQPRLHDEILQLHLEMSSSGSLPSSKAVNCLLGSGAGLTPSGDDFITGILLVLNRWKDLFHDQPDFDLFNDQIVEAAYQKTTTLSANLIECASLGLADERLISTLDWLVSGRDQGTNPGDELLTWGSSSGIDVFVGYVVALSL